MIAVAILETYYGRVVAVVTCEKGDLHCEKDMFDWYCKIKQCDVKKMSYQLTEIIYYDRSTIQGE